MVGRVHVVLAVVADLPLLHDAVAAEGAALVDLAVAVVVHAVAELLCAGIDILPAVVAVLAGRRSVAVHVHVDRDHEGGL